jgi:hypothetical protein
VPTNDPEAARATLGLLIIDDTPEVTVAALGLSVPGP